MTAPARTANADPELDALVAECWPRAQAHWSRFLLLQRPVDDGDQPSVAHINLGTRQVGLHYRLIRAKGLLDCVEALLAHEVGHHVRFPGSLAVQARLRLLEKALLPLEGYSLINLFTDLLINDALRPALEGPLVRVYQAFHGDAGWERDPAFLFYLAVYEERWQRGPGSLMGPAHAAFGRAYPGYRAEAQVLGQDLFHLGPNLYTQFLYFVSVVSRYVPPPHREVPEALDPYACGCGEPSADDWAESLTPDARERAAVRRALAEGWIGKEVAERLTDREALGRRIHSLLRRSVSECRAAQPIRAVITDGDFHHNYDKIPDAVSAFAEAARASPHFVLLLHATGDEGGRYRRAGARVITVRELEDYPALAAALAAALFEGGRHVAH
jgi:hypothetical protein